jgi:hypothetical protein
MIRKILIIFSTEFLRITSNEIQVLVSIIIVISSLMYLIKYKPYSD